MKDCIDKHKIKGVNLKEEAWVDEAGVIYADFLICTSSQFFVSLLWCLMLPRLIL